ncbi:MAG: DUF4238 domain-containing protein [Lewinellaceae bacterium]|nr:DUF4238 domain-containing protein [Lewinellaceae bacterium]
MSEPRKHHFVPEVYLQRFAINKSGDLFSLRVKSVYENQKVKKVNKSQVCYEFDKYTFKTDKIITANKLKDPNYIEKNRFAYENEELERLFNKIDYSKKLFVSEVRKLIQILLNFKRRNPSYSLEYLKPDSNQNLLNVNIERLEKEIIEAGMPKERAKAVIDKVKAEMIENLQDDDYKLDLYRNNLLNFDGEIERNDKPLIDRLLNWETTVFQTDYQNPFITSDNPGYTLKNFREVYNMNFDYIDGFAFPLSPKSLLYFSKSDSLNRFDLFKTINYKKATNRIVLLFNNGTIINSSKFIFSNTEEQLVIALEYINQKKNKT